MEDSWWFFELVKIGATAPSSLIGHTSIPTLNWFRKLSWSTQLKLGSYVVSSWLIKHTHNIFHPFLPRGVVYFPTLKSWPSLVPCCDKWNVAKMMLHEFQNLSVGCFAASAFALLQFVSSPSKEALAGQLNDKRSLGETVIAKSQH